VWVSGLLIAAALLLALPLLRVITAPPAGRAGAGSPGPHDSRGDGAEKGTPGGTGGRGQEAAGIPTAADGDD